MKIYTGIFIYNVRTGEIEVIGSYASKQKAAYQCWVDFREALSETKQLSMDLGHLFIKELINGDVADGYFIIESEMEVK